MKIILIIYSRYKNFYFIKKRYKEKNKTFIIIKKKYLKYYKTYNSIFFKNIKKFYNLIILKHKCNCTKIIHCLKHFFNRNHNSLFEKKINDIF